MVFVPFNFKQMKTPQPLPSLYLFPRKYYNEAPSLSLGNLKKILLSLKERMYVWTCIQVLVLGLAIEVSLVKLGA